MRRALLLFLLLLLPTTAAVALPPSPGACVEAACARVWDDDGQGGPERASGSLSGGEQLTLNANLIGNDLRWQADVTTNEFGGHDVEEAMGEAGIEAPILTLAAIGGAEKEGRPGADVFFVAYGTDRETGETEPLAWALFILHLP